MFDSIDATLKNLLLHFDQLIKELKGKSIQAIQNDNPDEAQEVLASIKKITEYKSHVLEIYNDWANDFGGPTLQNEQAKKFAKMLTSREFAEVTTSKANVKRPPSRSAGEKTIPDNNQEIISLDPDNFGKLVFSNIKSGTLGDIHVNNIGWKEFIEIGIKYALERGLSFDTLDKKLTVNLKRGKHYDHGYSPIHQTDISLQRMDANRAATSLIRLAKLLNCELQIMIEWGLNEKAQFPGQKACIKWTPPSLG